MKRRHLFSVSVALQLLLSLSTQGQKPLTTFVDPFIGTSAHGHTYPAACVPFGMVQVGPDTGIEGWDWCSGYHASDSSIMGFSHTHVSGTGCPEMGDILIMPMTGKPRFVPGTKKEPWKGYRSRFNRDSEISKPGYYAVNLDDCGIYAEMTATSRVGFHRYSFPQSSDASIIIDLEHGIGAVSYTHLRAHETRHDLVCRLLLEKKKQKL